MYPQPLSNQPFYFKSRHNSHNNSGQACLLLHGLGGGVYELRSIGERLHRKGFSVKAINYPGHDQPAKRMPASCWQDWVAKSLEAYEHLKQDHDRVSVIGFSTGCLVALQLQHQLAKLPIPSTDPAVSYRAVSETVFDKWVFLSPFFSVRHQWYYGLRPEAYVKPALWFVEDLPRFSLPIAEPVLRRHAEKIAFFKSFNLKAVNSALDLLERSREVLPTVKQPALIIQSKADSVVDPAGAAYCMQQLGSVHKQLLWLSRSNHVISLDHDRADVLRALERFLCREIL